MIQKTEFMLCCDCGHAVKEKNMFKKIYYNTAICLCKDCAEKLYNDLLKYEVACKGVDKHDGEERLD